MSRPKEVDEAFELGRLTNAAKFPDLSRRPRWRNTKCDVQVVWSALWHKADVLVTSDKGILSKAAALAGLGATVMSPASFAATISKERAEKDAP